MKFLSRLRVRYFTLMNGENKRLDYNLDENSIVVDLGSYHGRFALEIFIKFKCNVYSFEPLKQFYEYSKLTIKKDKIKFFNYALGKSNGKEILYLNEDETSFFNKSNISEEIDIREFNQAISDLDIKKIDLLKINIEGAEYDLLDHILENNIILKIKNLQIQFHSNIIDFKKRKKTITKNLRKTHKRNWYFSGVWENWIINQ
jgi:FkbM family methyltransferase